MIRQLCYLSAATPDFESGLERMTAAARRRNAELGVTSLIAHGGGAIFQVIEGPRDCVAAVFARVCRDRSHHNIRLLQDEAVAARDFDHWPLAVQMLDPVAVQGWSEFIAAKAIPTIIAGIGHTLGQGLKAQLSRAA